MANVACKRLLLAGVDAARYVIWRKLPTSRRHFLIACMPKSGSTYLTRIMGSLASSNCVSLVSGYGRREQELDTCFLLWQHRINYAAHHHVRYSDTLALQMSQFGVFPIVLVRNIFDIVVSLRDHFRNESVECSMGYAFPYMAEWEDAQIEEFIALMFIPWYLNFYLSWLECENKLFVTYEDMIRDPVSVVSMINKYNSFSFDEVEIEKAVQSANGVFTRKNKGITGRGEDLGQSVKDHICRMASLYTDVDFTPIGIES